MEATSAAPSRRLNSLLTWHPLPDGRGLQLRFPDGDHITIDEDADRASTALAALAAGEQPPEGSFEDELLALLSGRRMITESSDKRDWFVDSLDYFLGLAERDRQRASPVARARRVKVDLVGVGWLADLAKEAIALTGFEPAQDGGSITFAVSDLISYDLFSEVNAQAVREGRQCFFAWREVARIVTGPLVLPRQSACFDCYRARVRANVSFAAEFDAHAAWDPSKSEMAGSELARGVARGFLSRQLLLAAAGAYETVEPGTLHAFDLLSFESSRQPVLRMPRCTVCGHRERQPIRAVRAIA